MKPLAAPAVLMNGGCALQLAQAADGAPVLMLRARVGTHSTACSLPDCLVPRARQQHQHHQQDFRVPREVVWLNGAPGSGKVRVAAGHTHYQAALLRALAPVTHPLVDVHAPTAPAAHTQPLPAYHQGVNTQHILKTRGLTKHFTISGLLVREGLRAACCVRGPWPVCVF
jgi:hypothetical protein